MSIIYKLFIISCLVFLISSCSMSKMMVNFMNPIIEKASEAVDKSNDVEMVREAIASQIIQINGLLEVSPDNKVLLLAASKAYNGYGFAFIEDEDKKRAKKLYLKARNLALRMVKKKKKFIKALNGTLNDFLPTLNTLKKNDVPGLFWAIMSWMQWINLSLDNTDIFLDIPKIEAIIYKIIELDETYYHGGPHLSIASYYAAQAEMFGGNSKKAEYHFDKAFEISESKFLLVHLYYAKYYAVQIQDKELYLKTLKKIIDAPDDLSKKLTFANQIAKIKARELLNTVDDYFL